MDQQSNSPILIPQKRAAWAIPGHGAGLLRKGDRIRSWQHKVRMPGQGLPAQAEPTGSMRTGFHQGKRLPGCAKYVRVG